MEKKGRICGVGVPVGVRHGIEVIQVAEELIEAVHAGGTHSGRRGDSSETGLST